MTVDFSDPAIDEAIEKIRGDGETNWVLFSFVPKTTKLKVVDEGDEGLEELLDCLSDGKIMFSYMKYLINNQKKFVYIAWVGEGVQEQMKGRFHTQSFDVGEHIKFYHHSINARGEQDLDEGEILAALKKGSGANYDAGGKIQGSGKAITSVAEGRKAATQSNLKQVAVDRSEYKVSDARQAFWDKQKAVVEQEKRSLPAPNKSEYKLTEERNQFWQENQSAGIQVKKTEVNVGNRDEFWSQNQAKDIEIRKTEVDVGNRDEYWSENQATDIEIRKTEVDVGNRDEYWSENQATDIEIRKTEVDVGNREEFWAQNQANDVEVQKTEVDIGNREEFWANNKPEEIAAPEPTVVEEEPEAVQDDIQDETPPPVETKPPVSSGPPPVETKPPSSDPPPVTSAPPETPAAEESPQLQENEFWVVALYSFAAETETDLSFEEGDKILVFDDTDPDGWWNGEFNGAAGYFPSNFVEKC